MLNSIEQLEQILEENVCLLYGAGKVARAVIEYASRRKYRIEAILVSAPYENPNNIMGVPVYVKDKYTENLQNKCIIVSATENIYQELFQEITDLSCKKVFVSDELFRSILYWIGNYELDYLDKIERIGNGLSALEDKLLRLVPQPCLEYMILNILDHCNLRCKGCDHFACIADPYFVPYETIHSDLNRLSELFHGDYIMQIGVMGGEPLLHPELIKILWDVREHFPYTEIRLTTNGLLLLKQDDKFWKACRECNVIIVNTKYPINLKFDKMREKSESEGVRFQFFEGTGDHLVKKSFKKTINLKGNSNPVNSFVHCHMSNSKNFLMEGKFYGCPFSCQSYRIFNKKFNQNLRMTDKDVLDIYKVKNMQEILDFAARPKYYCRYCSGISPLFDWGRSKKEMSEWIDE